MKLSHLGRSCNYAFKSNRFQNICQTAKTSNVNLTRKLSDKKYNYNLESDKSWEGEYLRKHKKYYNSLEDGDSQKEYQSSIYDSEKINKLPHLIFEKKKPSRRNESEPVTNIDPDFERPEVHEILQKITGFDKEKIFTANIKPREHMAKVRLLTDAQVQMEVEYSNKLAKEKLRMTPVMLPRQPVDSVIEKDTELDGYERANVLFTDISDNLRDRERYVTIREPDGLLRTATWEERDRVMQVYFPKLGRHVIPPLLFSKDKLPTALQNSSALNIMARAERQFSLDSEDYIRVSQYIYDQINKNNSFDALREKNAADLVRLYVLLNPNSSTAKSGKSGKELLETYIKTEYKNTKNS